MNSKERWSSEWLDLVESAEKDKQTPENVC